MFIQSRSTKFSKIGRIPRKIFFTLFIIMLSFQINPNQMTSAEENEGIQPNILILLGDNFGLSYFDVRSELENDGCNVSTIGMVDPLQSCKNHERQTIHPDILFEAWDNKQFSQYDAIVIPAGFHHKTLAVNPEVQNWIQRAYKEGLVIGTICASIYVLAKTDGLLKKVEVARFQTYDSALDRAEANQIYQQIVVDGQIVTTGTGNTLTGGQLSDADMTEFVDELQVAIDSEQKRQDTIQKVFIFGSIGIGIGLTTVAVMGIKYDLFTKIAAKFSK